MWDFVPVFTLWDYVLWYFVLWDYVRVDFVLWDFVRIPPPQCRHVATGWFCHRWIPDRTWWAYACLVPRQNFSICCILSGELMCLLDWNWSESGIIIIAPLNRVTWYWRWLGVYKHTCILLLLCPLNSTFDLTGGKNYYKLP